jgi:hypothetical protein
MSDEHKKNWTMIFDFHILTWCSILDETFSKQKMSYKNYSKQCIQIIPNNSLVREIRRSGLSR